MKPLTNEVKTLLINGKPQATGNPKSLLRQAKRIIREKNIQNPQITLTDELVFKLEKAI